MKNKDNLKNNFNYVEIADKQQLLEDLLNKDIHRNAIKIPIKLK